MRKIKRTLAIFLSCVMTLGTCVVSFAEENELYTEASQTENEYETDVSTASDAEVLDDTENMDLEEELETLEIDANVQSYFIVPYISTYYFNPKPLTTENIQIPLYITDSEQSEYLNNDTSARLDLIYRVDGVEKTIKNLPLGDYTLTIGKLSEGMHTVSVQVLDPRTGMKSHRVDNELMVVASYDIPSEKVYTMTQSDLTKYGIKNNNSTNATDCLTTRDGLTKLFADKQAAGYKKIVLLKGTYRVNCEMPLDSYDYTGYSIKIPSYFTVDMNGATFKLDTITNTNPKTNAQIVSFDGSVDAHLTNGVFEGDRVEKQALGMETEAASKAGVGEHIGTIFLKGVKYCTLTDLTIRQTAGFTVYNQSELGPTMLITSYSKTAIFDGKEIQAESCSTSPMMDITKITGWEKNPGYIFVGHFGGYRGIQGDSPIVYVSFYDANQKYIETVTGYQFRKMKAPSNAKYARVTMLGEISPTNADTNIYFYNQNYGEYSAIKDCDFFDTRTCAIATATCNNLLVEGNKYTRCGNSITPLAVDFEDGAQEMQDIYYRNNEVVEKGATSTGTVVSCFGFNHVFENNKNHGIEIRSAVLGGVFRNTKDEKSTLSWLLGDKERSLYARVYNNDCGNITFADSKNKNIDFATVKIKDSTVRASWTEGVTDHVIYENCMLPVLNGGYATFRNCTIQPGSTLGNGFKFYDCTFKSADGGTMTLKFGGAVNATRIFDHCKFEGKTTTDHFFKSAIFKNCEFEDFSMIVPVDNDSILEALYFEKCTINSTASQFMNVGPWTSSVGYLNCVYKDCDITLTGKPVYMTGKTTAGSQIVFDDCTVNKTIDTSDLIKVINRSATKKNGLLTEGGKSYYYINDVKQTGWQMVEGKTCNFGTDGVLKIGWQKIDNKWYYLGTDGDIQSGWQTIGGKKYYLGNDGVMTTGWQTIDNKKYYFETDGVVQTGWTTIDSKKYYLWGSGGYATGTVEIDKVKYTFGSDGVLVENVVTKKNGLITENGKTYYYVNDVRQYGWKTFSDKTYYLGYDGVVRVGWQKIDNKKYYFENDGVMQTGWKLISDIWYYFGADGVMVTNKWVAYGSSWYYFNDAGTMMTNQWLYYKNAWYYFGNNGVMVSDKWLLYKGAWYYFDTAGVMLANKWLSYKGKWYYFDEDGIMSTAKWVLSGGKWYYLNASGVMVTGKQVINGKTYNFSASGAWIN